MVLPYPFAKEKNTIYAVIETPQRSRNKYYYNQENDFFQLKKVLPSGTSFPLDFGFIPHTLGEDGDPLDILIITDFPSFPGCIMECRVIGVIEAEQKEKKQPPVRNDRIIAVASASICHSQLENIEDINTNLLNDLIHFFEYYNEMEGKKFKLLHTRNKKAALKLIKQNIKMKK